MAKKRLVKRKKTTSSKSLLGQLGKKISTILDKLCNFSNKFEGERTNSAFRWSLTITFILAILKILNVLPLTWLMVIIPFSPFLLLLIFDLILGALLIIYFIFDPHKEDYKFTD